MFSGLSVIVDRESGARRELLAAPITRPLIVLGNLLVAPSTTALQVGVLLGFAGLRRIRFHMSATGMVWFVAVSLLFAVAMDGIAEMLAGRVARADEYIARVPAIAIVPWFLAGSLFPITALPAGLEWFARLPLTHALALMRYGLLDDPSGPRQHLAGNQPDGDGVPQPARRRRIRRTAEGVVDPRLHEDGGPLRSVQSPGRSLERSGLRDHWALASSRSGRQRRFASCNRRRDFIFAPIGREWARRARGSDDDTDHAAEAR